MCRERWVAYCIGLFLLFISVHTSYGIGLNISATVPLSPLWKEALRTNSEVKIDISHPPIALISQESLGVEKLPVEGQIIQLLVFKNGKLVSDQENSTNKKGIANFIFVSEQTGPYVVIVVNKTNTSPFIVKNAMISL